MIAGHVGHLLCMCNGRSGHFLSAGELSSLTFLLFKSNHGWERPGETAICSTIGFKHAVDICLICLLFKRGHLLNIQGKSNDKFNCWLFISCLYAHVVLQEETPTENCKNSYCNHCHLATGPAHLNSLTIFKYIWIILSMYASDLQL